MMKRRKVLKKRIPLPPKCNFCVKGTEPDFKEIESLKAFVSERGKILGKETSGLCSGHQRKLTTEIKRARFLALLPFTIKVR